MLWDIGTLDLSPTNVCTKRTHVLQTFSKKRNTHSKNCWSWQRDDKQTFLCFPITGVRSATPPNVNLAPPILEQEIRYYCNIEITVLDSCLNVIMLDPWSMERGTIFLCHNWSQNKWTANAGRYLAFIAHLQIPWKISTFCVTHINFKTIAK